MKRRQLTLLTLLILGVALWLTRGWWLPQLLAQIPALEKRADLIQTIDSIFSIVAWIVNLGMGYLLWLTHQQQEERRTDELAPLRATTWQTIRERSPQGARVAWIDRSATDANKWRAQPRLALIGLSGEGKSREAAELIRRAVEFDLVAETGVFEPNRDFLHAGAALTIAVLEKVVEPTQRACLFIDDLHSYSAAMLEQLATLLALYTPPQLDHRYVIATVRSDLVSAEQQEWLTQQGFHLVRLPKIDTKQAEQWLTSAGQVHSLTLSKKVRQTFIAQNQSGTPGHLLRGLLTIKSTLTDNNKGQAQIKPAQVAIVMSDLTAQERQALYRRQPLAVYLLTTLAHFHAAEVRTAQPLILAYAAMHYRRDHPLFRRWQARWRGQTLRRTLTYLLNFDVNVENGLIVTPDALLETTPADDARRCVGDFLVAYRRPFHNPLLRRFHRHAEAHRWAIFDLAMRCQEQNKLTNAICFYNVMLQVSPHSWCYNNRGTAYAEIGQLSAAIVDFNQAIALNPHDGDTFYNRGLAQQALRQFEKAIADYDQAITLNARHAVAFYNRGLAQQALGRFKDAIADFDQAIAFYSHSKDKAAAYNNRGTAYADFRQHQNAIADFDQAIALDPSYATAVYNRANARADLGQLVDAIDDFSQAIALFPYNRERAIAYSNRGLAFKNLGQLKHAIADFSQAIILFPEDKDKAIAYNNRGTIYIEQQKFEDAITDFNQAIVFNPNYADAYNNRGAALRAIDQHANSISDFNHAIALDPYDGASFGNRSLALYAIGDLTEAINDLEKAAQLFTKDSDKALTYEYLGDLYWEDRNEEVAVSAYQQALALGHSHVAFLRKVGSSYRKLKQWSEATNIYRQIVALNSQGLYDWLAIADIARSAGDQYTYQDVIAQARSRLSEDDAYGRACIASVAGNVEEALAALAQATQAADFDPTWAHQDPNLAWVRADSRFAEIVGKIIDTKDISADKLEQAKGERQVTVAETKSASKI